MGLPDELPVVAGGDAVCAAEEAAEVRLVGEAPAGGDRVDRAGLVARIGKVTVAALEPMLAYPGGDISRVSCSCRTRSVKTMADRGWSVQFRGPTLSTASFAHAGLTLEPDST